MVGWLVELYGEDIVGDKKVKVDSLGVLMRS